MRTLFYIMLLLITLSSCKKEEVLITGSVTGRLSMYDQFHKKAGDASGVEVALTDSLGIVGTTLTDSYGRYTFREVPYGRYELIPSKENYIRQKNPDPVYHIGGYSPTITSLYIYQVPTYEVTLDSAKFFRENGYLVVYMKIDGDTILPPNTYGIPFIAYAGSDPGISKEKHEWLWKGILADYSIFSYPATTVKVFGMIPEYNFSNVFNKVPGTFYICVYPLANGQGYFKYDFFPEALGIPSNVISFTWN